MNKGDTEHLAGAPRSSAETDCPCWGSGVNSIDEVTIGARKAATYTTQLPHLCSFVQGAPDIAACMYYTGLDPSTKEAVCIARGLRDRKMQRALMQFFKPENWFTVREALIQAGRQDLIGGWGVRRFRYSRRPTGRAGRRSNDGQE